jgi:NADP-dependent 3-hydroxy acid dehydrogenase YdfG
MEPPFPAPVTKWHNDTYDAIDPKRPELSMAGKIVVITGAGAGIGRETVRAFASAGATSIHILGRTESTLAETKEIVQKDVPGVSISLHTADVVDEIAVRKAASEVGSWDILISNAGYLPAKNPIQEVDLNDWWLGFEVGPLYLFIS